MNKTELIKNLKQYLKDEEDRLCDAWYKKTCPSGDVDQVQNQWLDSYDYEEFVEDTNPLYNLVQYLEGESYSSSCTQA